MTEKTWTPSAVAYQSAQRALADLKGAVYLTLAAGPAEGLQNAQIGRSLGIYGGHSGQEGHISRTLLEMLLVEGVVEQDLKTKRWSLRDQSQHRTINVAEQNSVGPVS